jgi:hypothetical protein
LLENERKLVNDVQLRTGYRVYLSLLRLRAASVKDIQESMKFATTGQAKYHLKRLADLGLAVQDENGTYRVTERKFGMLRFLFRVRNSVFPMSAFYSAFFAFLTILLFLKSPSAEVLLLGCLVTVKEIVDTYIFFSML